MNLTYLTNTEDLAERGLLSAILTDNRLLASAMRAGFEFHMISPLRLVLLEAIQALIDAQLEANEETLCAKLKDMGKLESAGGYGVVMGLAADFGGRNVAGFVAQVRRGYVRRTVLGMMDKFSREVERDAEDLPEKAAGLLHRITMLATPRDENLSWSATVKGVLERAEKALTDPVALGAVPTGITALDEITGGLAPSSLTVVCGETSGGKSLLMQQIALHAAARVGRRTVIVTLEMEAHELAQRAIAAEGAIPMTFLTRGRPMLPQEDFNRCMQAVESVAALPVEAWFRPDATLSWIQSSCLDISSQSGGLGCVVIDHLHLLTPEQRFITEEQMLSELTRRAKVMAGMLQCPVLLGSQLNDDGRLRGSRAIGMHANNVLRIEHLRDAKTSGILSTHLVIEKWRNGPRGPRVPMEFQGEYARFAAKTP